MSEPKNLPDSPQNDLMDEFKKLQLETSEMNTILKKNPPNFNWCASSDMLNEIRSLRAEIAQMRTILDIQDTKTQWLEVCQDEDRETNKAMLKEEKKEVRAVMAEIKKKMKDQDRKTQSLEVGRVEDRETNKSMFEKERKEIRAEMADIKKKLENQDWKLVSLDELTNQLILKMETLPIKEAIVGSWKMISSRNLESLLQIYRRGSVEMFSTDVRFAVEGIALATYRSFKGVEELNTVETIQLETNVGPCCCYINENHFITAANSDFHICHDRYIEDDQLHIETKYSSYTCERVYERI